MKELSAKEKIEKLEKQKLSVEEKIKRHFRKEVSEEFKQKALEYKDLMDPIVLKNVFGIKTTRKSKTEESKKVVKKLSQKATKEQKDMVPKESVFNTVSVRGGKLKKGDSAANIAAKILLFMKKSHDDKSKMMELARNFHKAKEEQEDLKYKENLKKLHKRIPEQKKEEEPKGGGNLLKYGLMIAGGLGLLLFAEDAHASFGKMQDEMIDLNKRIKGLLQNPEESFTNNTLLDQKSLRDLIRKRESGNDYNRLVSAIGGDKNLPDEFKGIKLTDMTIEQVIQLQEKMKASGKFPSTAAGGYQIIEGTLKRLSAKEGLDIKTTKFTSEVQDKFAEDLLQEAGSSKLSRGEITQNQYQTNVAKTFASVPVPESMHVEDKFGKRDLKPGQSYYDAVGTNKALIRQEEISSSIGQDLVESSKKLELADIASKTKTIVLEKETIVKSAVDGAKQLYENKPNLMPPILDDFLNYNRYN
jgi:hypothetical protein